VLPSGAKAGKGRKRAVAVFYMSDYGLVTAFQAIAHGITKTGVAVEMMDLNVARQDGKN